MGLFDRFKKQKNAEVQETQQTVEAPKAAEEIKEEEAKAVETPVREKEPKEEPVKVMNESTAEPVKAVDEPATVTGEAEVTEKKKTEQEFRRFTLVVEDLSVLPEEQGVVAGGILHGSLQVGDEIFIIHPMGNIITSTVDGIEVGPNQTAERAENQKITVLLKGIKTATQMPKYTVLTSIKPQTTVDTRVAVENPQLLAMSLEYPRLCKDNNYMNIWIYVVCHAHYVVPARMDGESTSKAQQGTKTHFPALQNPTDKSKNVFPIFTDWAAMSNWKNLFDEAHPPKAIIMRFPDVVAVSKGCGIVINAFGPTYVLLPEQMIEYIVGMEGYKQEFGGTPAETVKKMQMEQEAKVVVGVPKENEEIKLIKEALVTLAEREKEIQRVDFLLKVDVQKERAYLCIVDCPEEQATKLFTGIHKAVAPYLNEVKRLEFLLYGKTKLANDVVSEKSCIYQA